MRRLPLVLVLLAMIAAPGSLVAQEEDEDESPMTLRLSFYMCDSNRIDEALEEVESQDIPVWQELVDEGMVENYGHIVHSWASEWNIGIYTIAESIDAVIQASQEAGSRLEEKYGEDAPNVFGEVCPHHRDAFYTFGPSTEDADDDDEEAAEAESSN